MAYGNILAYYEKKLDREPLGILFLENHIIEMVDDLTMVIRFLTLNELPKGYYLRSDSTEDIEQWMRILSRSGIDFFTLTLEDLEDQLRAVSVVNRVSSNASLMCSTERGLLPECPPLQIDQSFRRPNPFNSCSIFTPATTTAGDTRPTPGFLATSVKHSSQSSPADMQANRPDQLETNCGLEKNSHPPPLSTNIQWLLSQDWQQLHAKVRMQLSEAQIHLSPESLRQPPEY